MIIMLVAVKTAINTITTLPSRISRIGGRVRITCPSVIRKGANTMMPTASDSHHAAQISKNDAVGLATTLIVAEARTAIVAALTPAATKNHAVARKSLNSKCGPNRASIIQANNSASPALHRPNTTAMTSLRSPSRLAATVAANTPMPIAPRQRLPRKIKAPAANPDAGQKIATLCGCAISASPTRAAAK